MCKMIGIGVDLCSVSRMEEAIKKTHFFHRIFLEGERSYIDAAGKGRAQSAAATFAAKEAVAKAMGTGFADGVAPWLIEVTHEKSGAPGIVLHGGAKERLEEIGGGAVLISMSHEDDTAIAFAMIQKKA